MRSVRARRLHASPGAHRRQAADGVTRSGVPAGVSSTRPSTLDGRATTFDGLRTSPTMRAVGGHVDALEASMSPMTMPRMTARRRGCRRPHPGDADGDRAGGDESIPRPALDHHVAVGLDAAATRVRLAMSVVVMTAPTV
jgi:hypothetical protein